MRTELVNGRWLLCGHILATEQIKPGQAWAPASGANRTVRVESVDDKGRVTYSWLNNRPGEIPNRVYHDKEAFAFQCRYCLVLDGPDIPPELL